MKRSILSIATISMATAASAQSNIQLFGVVDASMSSYSTSSRDQRSAVTYNPFGVPVGFNPAFVNQGTVKLSKRALANSAYNQSRLGFKGTEDLGGGLAASFWLEAPITNDDGQTGISAFSRRSSVSLSGPFGEVRLGRDYTPSLWNDTVFDPFGTSGVGTSLIFSASLAPNAIAGAAAAVPGIPSVSNSNYVRASNSVGYFLPANLGGFYGQVMYTFHEKTKYDPGTSTTGRAAVDGNDSRTGRYVGTRFGYAQGPFDIAVAYGDSTVGDNYYAGATTHTKTVNAGASYDFGSIKLMGELSRVRRETEFDGATFAANIQGTSFRGQLLGFTLPIGPGLIRGSIAKVRYDNTPGRAAQSPPEATQLALGYVHNLSKRTALYATFARLTNKNGSALNIFNAPAPIATGGMTPHRSTGYDFGIRHAF